MKTSTTFAKIRAAQRLSLAFEAGKAPSNDDLETLRLPSRLKSSFMR